MDHYNNGTIDNKINRYELGEWFADFWKEQAVWSQTTFGSDERRGAVGPLKHAYKECGEAIHAVELVSQLRNGNASPDEIETARTKAKIEIADIFILACEAARRFGMTPLELLETVYGKLQRNKSRQWPKPSANDEPIEHVRTQGD